MENNLIVKTFEAVMVLNKKTLKIKLYSKWFVKFTRDNSISCTLGFSKRLIQSGTIAYSDLPVERSTNISWH